MCGDDLMIVDGLTWLKGRVRIDVLEGRGAEHEVRVSHNVIIDRVSNFGVVGQGLKIERHGVEGGEDERRR